MSDPNRELRIDASQPGGEPICLLDADTAHARRAPIDRLLEHGDLTPTERGYEIRLPRDEDRVALARQFIVEEARCCPAFSFAIEERGNRLLVRASY